MIVVVVIVAIILITVVLSAVLYVMTMGFHSPSIGPYSVLTKSTVTDGVELTFAPVTVDTQWSDITVLLSDGTNTVQWSPATTDLVHWTTVKVLMGAQTLTSLSVYCNVTDNAGNGYINGGDYFTLTTGGGSFSSATTYTCTIIYEPRDTELCYLSFNG